MTRSGRTWRRRRVVERILVFTLLGIGLVLVLFPLFWLVSTAFKYPVDASAIPPTWIFVPTLDNFSKLLSGPFLGTYWNSVVITAISTATSLILGVPAGFALSRVDFRGRRQMGTYLVVSRVAPAVVFIIPLFAIFLATGLVDSYLGLMLAYLTFMLPFVAWLMSGYFADLQGEIWDAALVDGCSNFGALRHIALPLALPGISTVAILAVIMAFEQYFFPLILGGPNTTTATVSVISFIGVENLSWGQMAAAGLMLVAPVFVLSVVGQGGLIRGLTAGAVRG
jgi:multiple sugar transport system permease protein